MAVLIIKNWQKLNIKSVGFIWQWQVGREKRKKRC